MLDKVRRSAKSGLSYILVAGLIVIFAFFFGMPADSCGSARTPGAAAQGRRYLGSVAGQQVYTDDINVIYNAVSATNDRDEQAQDQRQRALALKSYLIIEMLAHKARQAGLRASEQEFKNYMRDPLRNSEFPIAYGRSGSWNGKYYKRYVQNLLGVSLKDYEDFKRDELVAQKYMNLVDMQIGVLPGEVADHESLRDTKVNLEFAKFDPSKLSAFLEVSDQEVAQYVDEHSDRIKTYYDQHADQYTTAAKMQIRRIYLEPGKQGPDGKTAEQRFKLAKERLDDGEPFADVAGDINDARRDQQGLMDMRPTENMNQEIVDKFDGADLGDVRELRSPDQFVIVKLVDRQKATKTPLADAQATIARTLVTRDKARGLIDDMSARLIEQAKSAPSLSAALAELNPSGGLPGETSAETGAGQSAPEATNPPNKWAAVSVGETGDFTLEENSLAGMAGRQMGFGGSSWDTIPKIGQNRKIAADAFTVLTDDQPLAKTPYQVDESRVVVRLNSKKKIDPGAEQPDTSTADKTPDGQKASAADTASADGDDEQASAATEKLKLVNKLRARKLGDLVGQWQRLFQRRTIYGSALKHEYGPWIEHQYKQAVDSGLIELDPSAGPIVAMIDPNTTTAASPDIPEGLGQKGGPGSSPIEVKPSQGGSGSSPIEVTPSSGPAKTGDNGDQNTSATP